MTPELDTGKVLSSQPVARSRRPGPGRDMDAVTGARQPARSRDALQLLPLLGFAFAVLCTALPVLLHLYLPLIDLPNHIARLAVAATHGTGPLAEYYEYSAGFVPNAAVDLLWLAIGTPGDPARFSQAVMAFYAVNMVAATMVLSRALHGRWMLWPAVSGLLVFNMAFYLGFQNFLVSLPFAIHAMALWLVMEGRAERLRWLIFIPIGLALYVMHLFAFAALAAALFGREVQRLIEEDGPLPRRLLMRSLAMLPMLPPVVALAVLMAENPGNGDLSYTTYGGLISRWSALLSPTIQLKSTGLDWMRWVNMGSYAVLGMALLRILSTSGPRLVLDRRLYGPAAALFVLSMVVPHWLQGVAWLHIRFPIALFALLIGGSAWHGLSSGAGRALAVVLALSMAAKGVAFERFAASFDADARDLLALTESLPEGARILPLREAGWKADWRFSHIQALLVDTRGAFVPTLFQHVHGLQVKPEWSSHAHPALFSIDMRHAFDPPEGNFGPEFVRDWQRKFTHVLIMHPGAPEAPQSDGVTLIGERGRMALYRVNRP